MINNLTNGKDAAYSESGIKREIQEYEAWVKQVHI